MRIDNDGVGLEVHVDGPREGPPVLLLHGIISSSRTWDWLVPELARTHRVLRLDFRGHGDSDRAPGAYQPADYLSDAVAACEQVARARAVVIGHSLGGITAAALAQQHRELVVRAVLEDPPLGQLGTTAAGDGGRATPGALTEVFALMRQSIPKLQGDGASVDDLTAMLTDSPTAAGATFGELLEPDGIASMAAGMLAVDASVLDPALDGTSEPVYVRDRPIDLRVVAMAADPALPDAVCAPADLAELAATSPAVTTHVFEGAGHMIHDTLGARDRYREIVIDALRP